MPEGSQASLPIGRPALPVVFTCSLAFWVSCAAAYSTGATRACADSQEIAATALVLTLVLAACALLRPARFACLVGASLAVGCALGGIHASGVVASAEAYGAVDSAEVSLEVVEDSREGASGEAALVRGRVEGLPEAVFSARLAADGPLLCGDRLVGVADFRSVDPATDDFAWRNGSCASLTVRSFERRRDDSPLRPLRDFRAWAIGFIGDGSEASCLLQALVCGYRRNVSGTAMYSDFQACGLAHLVAVSGAHLVIVTGLAASVLRGVRCPRRLTVAVLVALMAAYYVVAGMPVSALRASVMSAVGLTSYLGGRRSSSLNSVGVGVFAIVLADPAASVSASFVLSALATAGIVLFGPLFRSWVDGSPLGRFPALAESLAMTASASVLSQPYACSLFNLLPLASPVANALCAPLFPVTCFCGLAAVLLGSIVPPLGETVVAAGCAACACLRAVVSCIASVPYAAVPVCIGTSPAIALSALTGALLWLLWPIRGFRAAPAGMAGAAMLAIAAILLFPHSGDRIVMLNVGQGDAILVQSRGQALLVDTGNQDSMLLGELARNGIFHLDGVLVTHADDDHCGSLDALQRAVEVDRVIVAAGMDECAGASARGLMDEAGKTAPEIVQVRSGDRFAVGAFAATVVWPHDLVEEGGNADSICLLLEYDGDGDGSVDCSALMTGDAENEQLAEMLDSGAVGSVDILKVGHHGSRNGMTQEQAHALSPKVALVSCGLNNRYGHPTREILDMLDQVGAATYRTDQDGTVTCDLSSGLISVSTGP